MTLPAKLTPVSTAPRICSAAQWPPTNPSAVLNDVAILYAAQTPATTLANAVPIAVTPYWALQYVNNDPLYPWEPYGGVTPASFYGYQNSGNGFGGQEASTFTAPVAGVYHFDGRASSLIGSVGSVTVTIAAPGGTLTQTNSGPVGTNTVGSAGVSGTITMAKGDVAQLSGAGYNQGALGMVFADVYPVKLANS